MLDLDDDKYKNMHECEDCERVPNPRKIKKYMQEMLKSKTAPLGPHELIAVLDNMKGEFNLPRIVRSANLFGCREVFIAGTEYFNPYPAVGAVRHTRIRNFKSMDEALLCLKEMDYTVYALQPPNYEGSDLFKQVFSDKTAFIAGHEEYGISIKIENYPFIKPLHIPQFGIIESLNVSVAMSIALSEWVRQKHYLTNF
jgi:tRNA G18 (ribose-2'-O)-methylase SpoU